MALHLVKLCVGASSIEDLAIWQAGRLTELRKVDRTATLFHTTYQAPKRQAELLDGGSLYWVIKGVIQARQRLIGFSDGQKADGSPCCLLLLDKDLVRVRPVPRRAFQGWRYLSASDAPDDCSGDDDDAFHLMPAKMRRELADLCLI